MNPELEKLIDAVLADGVVTDNERAVLHRKAKELGVDPDEVDIHVDSRLQAKRNDAKPKKPTKCPSCGAPISGISRVCGDCGHVFEDGGPGGAPDLHKTLDKLNEFLAELKAIPVPGSSAYTSEQSARSLTMNPLAKAMGLGGSVPEQGPEVRYQACLARLEKEKRTVSMYFGENSQVQRLLKDIESEVNERNKKVATGEVKHKVTKAIILGGSLLVFAALIGGIIWSNARDERNRAAADHARVADEQKKAVADQARAQLQPFLGRWRREATAPGNDIIFSEQRFTCSENACAESTWGEASCSIGAAEYLPNRLTLTDGKCMVGQPGKSMDGCKGFFDMANPGTVKVKCGAITVIEGEFWKY